MRLPGRKIKIIMNPLPPDDIEHILLHSKHRFTHLIHGAVDASLKLIQEEPLLIFDTIIQGTRRVLETCILQSEILSAMP